MKINIDIVNDVICKHTKFHYKILYIMSYIKITKSHKFVDCKIYIFKSIYLLFLCSPKYNVLNTFFPYLQGK
jgi:hypothetical protein